MPHHFSMPCIRALNLMPNTEPSIVDCFFKSQLIILWCQLNLSLTWLLSTNIHRVTPFQRGLGALGGMALVAPAQNSITFHKVRFPTSGSIGSKMRLKLLFNFRKENTCSVVSKCPSCGITEYNESMETLVRMSIHPSLHIHLSMPISCM